ncbi:hypothetical protein FRB98_006884 [Tulasnella sp. 332]|nr:hypothetical protein FRB98_006884 [Tulasnella sp. 332]
MTLLLSLGLFFFWLLISVTAGPANITVQADNINLTYAGTGVATSGDVYGGVKFLGQACGLEYSVTDTSGNTVSMEFSGTAIQYTFLTDHQGSIGSVMLDGTQVDLVNTNQFGAIAFQNCNLVTGSVAVPAGSHTVTVSNQPPSTSQASLYFQSFAYTPLDVPTLSSAILTSANSIPASATTPSLTINAASSTIQVVQTVISTSSIPNAAPISNQTTPAIVGSSSTAIDVPPSSSSQGQTTSIAADSSSTSNHTTAIAGAIAGVIGVSLIIVAVIYVTRRRRPTHVVDLGETGTERDISPLQTARMYHPQPYPEPALPFAAPASSSWSTPPTMTSSSQTTSYPNPMRQQEPGTLERGSAGSGGVDHQAEFIRELIQHEVPGPEIAILIREMAARNAARSSTSGYDLPGPPAYDFTTSTKRR